MTNFPPRPDIEILPKVVKSRDWDLFNKECLLAGWDLIKLARNKKVVICEDWACLYRRTKKLWLRQGWVGVRTERTTYTPDGFLNSRQDRLDFFEDVEGVGNSYTGVWLGRKR